MSTTHKCQFPDCSKEAKTGKETCAEHSWAKIISGERRTVTDNSLTDLAREARFAAQIQQKIEYVEKQYGVRVIYAVRAGSRVWGYASPNSDCDVHFIYVKPMRGYLLLDPARDVIELPEDKGIEMSGWDIQKFLKLVRNSNPSAIEWMCSELIYKDTGFKPLFEPYLHKCFSAKKCLYHYLHLSTGNYVKYIDGKEEVKLKKYLGILRSLLAGMWLADRKTLPPLNITTLAEAYLPQDLKPIFTVLLDSKIYEDRTLIISRIPDLDVFILESVKKLNDAANKMICEPTITLKELNRLFQSIVLGDNLAP